MNGAPTLTSVNQTDILDKPWLITNPSSGDLFLAVTWQKTAGGVTLLLFRSLDGGQSWEHREFVDSIGAAQAPYLALNGNDLYLFWRTTGTEKIRIAESTDQGATFATGEIPNSEQFNGDLRRNSHDPSTFAGDTFDVFAIFQVAFNPQSGDLYVVYHTIPSGRSDSDVFLQYFSQSQGTWSTRTRINDVQTGDQWQPCVAVKPDGSKLFVGWYDRKHDVTFDHRIKLRGMISTITAQTPLTSPNYFDISAEDFAPVFTGGQTIDGTFDPVYGGPKESTTVDAEGNLIHTTERCGQLRFHMGDYDKIFSDATSIYYCWGDNRIRRSNRLQADIRFKKIGW
jgi:hypothetical protein